MAQDKRTESKLLAKYYLKDIPAAEVRELLQSKEISPPVNDSTLAIWRHKISHDPTFASPSKEDVVHLLEKHGLPLRSSDEVEEKAKEVEELKEEVEEKGKDVLRDTIRTVLLEEMAGIKNAFRTEAANVMNDVLKQSQATWSQGNPAQTQTQTAEAQGQKIAGTITELALPYSEIMGSMDKVDINVEAEYPKVMNKPLVQMYYGFAKTMGFEGSYGNFIYECVKDAMRIRGVGMMFYKGFKKPGSEE